MIYYFWADTYNESVIQLQCYKPLLFFPTLDLYACSSMASSTRKRIPKNLRKTSYTALDIGSTLAPPLWTDIHWQFPHNYHDYYIVEREIEESGKKSKSAEPSRHGVGEDRVEGELVEDWAATDQQHVPSHLRLQERRKKMVDSFPSYKFI